MLHRAAIRNIRRILPLLLLILTAPAIQAQNLEGYGWTSFGVLPFKGVDYRIFKTPSRYIMYYIKNGFPTPDTTNAAHGRAFSTDLKSWTVDNTNFCSTAGDFCTATQIQAGVMATSDGRFRTFFHTPGNGLSSSLVSSDGLVWKQESGSRLAPDTSSIYERGDFTMAFASFVPLPDGSTRMYYLGEIVPGSAGTPAWYNQTLSFNGVLLKNSCVILSAISKDDGLTWVREPGVRVNPLVQGPVRNQAYFDKTIHAEMDGSDVSAVVVTENGKTVYRIYAPSWGTGTVSYVSSDGLSFSLEGQVPADRGDPKAIVMADGRTWLVTNQYPDGINDTIVYGPQSLFVANTRSSQLIPGVTTTPPSSPYTFPFRSVAVGVSGTATGTVNLEAVDGSVSNCIPGPCAYHPEYYSFNPSSGTPPFSSILSYIGPATNYSNDMLVIHARSADTTADGAVYCMNEQLDKSDTNVFCKARAAELPMNRMTFAFSAGAAASTQVSNILSLGGPGYPYTVTSSVPWATVSPATGTAPAALTVKADPAGLTPGTYTGTLSVTAEGTTQNITVTAVVSAGPVIASVRNAGSLAPGIVPNAFITIFGSGFAPSPVTWSPVTSLPVTLGGVSVKIAGKDAFISYADSGQLNVLIPADLTPGAASLTVTTSVGSATTNITVAKASPAWFAYTVGSATWLAALIGNASVLTYAAPAGTFPGVTSRAVRVNDIVVLFANGLGATNPVAPIGAVLTTGYPLDNLSRVKVTIAGIDAPVLYAGLVAAGLYQLNVQVPAGIGIGELQVVMYVDGQPTQGGVTLNFQ